MNNNFTTEHLTKSQTIDANSMNRLYKLNVMFNFLEIRSNNPRMTQNQICKHLCTSDSTIKRYRDDIEMDSPYNRNQYKKKSNKSNTTNENTKNNKKDKKNNISKGGNPDKEQAFQNDEADSILENKHLQEDNIKFITLPGRMVNNS